MMNILQSFRMAFKSIATNKMRALLTMLGIIIGVVSLVVLVSLVTSATSSVTSQISSMANDMITVQITDSGTDPIKLEDLGQIESLSDVELVAPSNSSSATAKVGTDSYSVSITGTNNAYFHIQGYELEAGRYLLQSDLDNNAYAVVLSYEAAATLYSRTDVVGQKLSMDSIKYTIVGVLADSDSLTSSFASSNSVYIPYTTAMRISSSGWAGSVSSGISTLYVGAANETAIDAAQTETEAWLLARFGDSDAYSIRSNDTMADTMESVTNTFALLLGGIAAISLLVGGIGIMNIMLVSVTERTREIGIRKSVGATDRFILLQFLVEALVICLMGCAIGVLISTVCLAVVNFVVEDSTYRIAWWIVLVAVAFSTLIGAGFGLYPASKAARMNPIDALRYE